MLCPNTAIRAQWIAQWHAAFGPAAETAGAGAATAIRVLLASQAKGTVADMALATADALHEAGLTSRDGSAVRLEPVPGGSGARAR